MNFLQLFDTETSTYTYLLADPNKKECIIIDSVDNQLEVYLDYINANNFTLKYILETHVHADHITAAGLLRDKTGAITAVGSACGAHCANLQLEDGDLLTFGDEFIQAMDTPGHTPGSISFCWRDRVFTGDCMLIGGCGRTDFQGGDPHQMYHSLKKLHSLSDDTLVYPGHDYKGRTVSTIKEERVSNQRIAGKTEAEFVEIMNNLNLKRPVKIDEAVPANKVCGLPQSA
ncbi:MAG: MBL fold metallo-hydrolase [bacterium]